MQNRFLVLKACLFLYDVQSLFINLIVSMNILLQGYKIFFWCPNKKVIRSQSNIPGEAAVMSAFAIQECLSLCLGEIAVRQLRL